MDPQGGVFLATKMLRHLAVFYDRPNIEELVVNRFGYVMVKEKGQAWVEEEAPELTYDYLSRMCRVLANINQSRFSETEMPVVSCQVPNQPMRLQAIIGSNVRYDLGDQRGVAISIRSLRAQQMGFERWGLTGDAKLLGAAAFFDNFAHVDDHIERLKTVISQHQSIVVSGATSTGKTTFTNGIIEMIHPQARVITVEDTPELTVPQVNRVRLMVQRNQGVNQFGWNQAVDSLMRLTPDWVICGEVSVNNASTIYSLMGKGHPVVTTVHSNTPKEAMEAFVTNMQNSGNGGDDLGNVRDQLESLVGCVIQLERRNNKRQVTDITFPSNLKNQELAVREAKRKQDIYDMAQTLNLHTPTAA